MKELKLIDISKNLLDSEPRAGATPAVIKTVTDEKSGAKNSMLLTSLCNGTHIIFPSAFCDNAKGAEEYEPSRFIGECQVVKAKGALTGMWIDNMFLLNCEKLLIKGSGKGKIDVSAAEELVAEGVKLIGTDADCIAIEGMENEVYRIFAEADCLVLEGLNLEKAEMSKYFLMAQPVLIEGAESAPCRAVLADGYIYWNKS